MTDYIDRQAALNIADEYLARYCKYIGTPEDNEECAAMRGLLVSVKIGLERVPTEVEPVKRGRWIIKDDSFTYGIIRAVHWYECSDCGGIAYVEYPYCPHCGAKMEGKEE